MGLLRRWKCEEKSWVFTAGFRGRESCQENGLCSSRDWMWSHPMDNQPQHPGVSPLCPEFPLVMDLSWIWGSWGLHLLCPIIHRAHPMPPSRARVHRELQNVPAPSDVDLLLVWSCRSGSELWGQSRTRSQCLPLDSHPAATAPAVQPQLPAPAHSSAVSKCNPDLLALPFLNLAH